jgi:hypothetical protein
VAMGSAVGDSYDKVIADNGPPKSKMEVGSMRVLTYQDYTIKTRDDVVISITATAPAPKPPPAAQATPMARPADGVEAPTSEQLRGMNPVQQATVVQAVLKRAVDRVTAIVNQPVPSLPLSADMGAGVWTGGWFHPGAVKPEFNSVDVRMTQDTASYSKFPFVTSNLNPGIAFPGDQVEFNPMTKIFYQDLTLPKKRLTEAEMVEINRLYRVIGVCAAQMAALNKQ